MSQARVEPWGSREGRVPGTGCRWRGAQLRVEAAPGEGRTREVPPSGHRGEEHGGVRVGAAFWFPLPPPSFQCLSSSSTSLPSPPPLWAGSLVREGVRTAQEAKRRLLPAPGQGRADRHAALQAQGGRSLSAEWPQGKART